MNVRREQNQYISLRPYSLHADLAEEIVRITILYALQKGNLVITTEEKIKTFPGINMAMSYLRYPRSRMYWSSEEGLCLCLCHSEEFQSIDKQIIPFKGHLSHKQYILQKTPLGSKSVGESRDLLIRVQI